MNSWKIVSDDDDDYDDDYDDDIDDYDDDDDTSWNLGQNRRRRRALFSHYVDSDILKIALFRVWLLIKDLWRGTVTQFLDQHFVSPLCVCIRACTYVRV